MIELGIPRKSAALLTFYTSQVALDARDVSLLFSIHFNPKKMSLFIRLKPDVSVDNQS